MLLGGRARATLGDVTTHRLTLEGPASATLEIATALADAEGVDLVSSEQPRALDGGRVTLHVTVDAEFDAVADAVAGIRGRMPAGASIEITGG